MESHPLIFVEGTCFLVAFKGRQKKPPGNRLELRTVRWACGVLARTSGIREGPHLIGVKDPKFHLWEGAFVGSKKVERN